MKLNLGSGNDYRDDCINVDVNKEGSCDVVVDLENDNLPWKDGEIDEIVAHMILEHIIKRDRLMNECWRVLKPGGKIDITVPMGGTVADFKDPTHISHWIPETFRYYCDWNTCPANQRKTWEMIRCERDLIGDENEFVSCILKKPDEYS